VSAQCWYTMQPSCTFLLCISTGSPLLHWHHARSTTEVLLPLGHACWTASQYTYAMKTSFTEHLGVNLKCTCSSISDWGEMRHLFYTNALTELHWTDRCCFLGFRHLISLIFDVSKPKLTHLILLPWGTFTLSFLHALFSKLEEIQSWDRWQREGWKDKTHTAVYQDDWIPIAVNIQPETDC